MAWFDTHSAAAVLAAFPESSAAIQAGIGEKLTDAVRYTTQLLTGLILGFVTSWKLTLVISALAPIFATALTVLIITNLRTGKQTSEAYARAGGVASEVRGARRRESAARITHVIAPAFCLLGPRCHPDRVCVRRRDARGRSLPHARSLGGPFRHPQGGIHRHVCGSHGCIILPRLWSLALWCVDCVICCTSKRSY